MFILYRGDLPHLLKIHILISSRNTLILKTHKIVFYLVSRLSLHLTWYNYPTYNRKHTNPFPEFILLQLSCRHFFPPMETVVFRILSEISTLGILIFWGLIFRTLGIFTFQDFNTPERLWHSELYLMGLW